MSSPHANHQGEAGDTGTGDRSDIWLDFAEGDYKPDLASAIAAEIMGLKWTHVLPASDDIHDQMKAQEEHCNRYGDVQEVVSAVLAKARTEPHTVLIASAPTPPDRVGEEVGRFICAARRQGTAGGNGPTDCDWPVCGCDPYADKAIAALEEAGKLVGEETKGADPYLTETTEALVARLEAELGVKGINSVFRRAMAIAKEASADAKMPKGLVGAFSGDAIREIDCLSASNPALDAAPSHVTGTRTITLPALKADQIAYLRDLQASLQAETQFDTETRIGPAGPAAGFDGYGSQARPLEAKSSPDQTPVDPQMTVEEAREVTDREQSGGRNAYSQVKYLRMLADQWAATTTEQRTINARADKLEAALRTLQTAGEVR